MIGEGFFCSFFRLMRQLCQGLPRFVTKHHDGAPKNIDADFQKLKEMSVKKIKTLTQKEVRMILEDNCRGIVYSL
jgi:hypothetical protein